MAVTNTCSALKIRAKVIELKLSRMIVGRNLVRTNRLLTTLIVPSVFLTTW